VISFHAVSFHTDRSIVDWTERWGVGEECVWGGELMSIAVASTVVRSARHTVVAYIIFIIYYLLFSIFFLLIAAPDILERGQRRK
jgi:hypothetical protein